MEELFLVYLEEFVINIVIITGVIAYIKWNKLQC